MNVKRRPTDCNERFQCRVRKNSVMWRGVIRKDGIVEMNERDEGLLNFFLTNNLKILNTAFFLRKEN